MKLKVLVVEDDATVRDVLITLLGFDGLEVVSAEDGATGLSLAERIRPDVVLLDVGLPVLDGFDVCRAIRRQAPKTRIVMLTGRASEEAELEGVAAGADAYVRKPFSPLELLEAVGVGESEAALG